MCGIAGSFSYHEAAAQVDYEELVRISEHMRARGPDGDGLWVSDDKRVGLAHRRLAIIDLTEAATQPMLDPYTGNYIVFNGEIYNFVHLRNELEQTGHRFESHSDTEVLLKLYATHGPQMLHRLRGMYAFAVWDERKKGIFLARDPFGIKPLYYVDDGKSFRFASQVKALLAGGRVDTALHPAGQVGFYLWGHVPEPFTLYKNIAALPAGNSMWIDDRGRHDATTFLDISKELFEASSAGSYPIPISSDEARERLSAALNESVHYHLIADVSVGLFLSAGLDSATLTALTAEHSEMVSKSDQLRTITLGFEEFANTDDDEVPLAETIASHYGTEHNTLWVGKDRFTEQLEHLLHSMDQPSIDGVNSYFVCLAAKEAGVKVALSGLGGDELFGGYSSFTEIPSMVRLLHPVSRVPFLGRGFRLVTAPLLKHFTSPKYAGLLEYGGEYGGAYLLRRGLFMPWELPEVLDGELVKEGWEELNAMSHLRKSVSGISDPRLMVSSLEATWYMRNRLLRDTDWSSMAHSLEVRVPLVDIELLRTVAHLVNSGSPPSKLDMAMTPGKRLPDSVLNRRKTGFSIPLQEWLLDSLGSELPWVGRGLRSWANFLHQHAAKA
jgi:asparagine synthase (glutamine-hydrolysing)